MYSVKNVRYFAVGDNLAYTSATSSEDILTGEVALVDQYGTVITTSNDALNQKFRIVQGRDNTKTPRISDLIDPQNITSISFKEHVSPVEQVSHVGFNGTTGSIEVINNNLYFLRLYLEEIDRLGNAKKPMYYGSYISDATATQWEVAKNVAENFNANRRKAYEKDVKAECVLDVASATEGTHATGDSDTVNVVNGSAVISEYSTTWGGATAAVGEVLVISGAAYEIIEIINSDTYRVHMPYQGATATNVAVVSYTAASVATTASGIKLTGIEREWLVNSPDKPYKVRFTTNLDGFGTTTFTATTAAEEGHGNYKQVAKEELFYEGTAGNIYRRDHLYTRTVDTDLTGATYYGCVTIHWEDTHQMTIGTNPVSKKMARIFLGDGSAGGSWSETGTAAANIQDIINTITGVTYTWIA
jgi:hypothetical protein